MEDEPAELPADGAPAVPAGGAPAVPVPAGPDPDAHERME
jgi:hypothetical protein